MSIASLAHLYCCVDFRCIICLVCIACTSSGSAPSDPYERNSTATADDLLLLVHSAMAADARLGQGTLLISTPNDTHIRTHISTSSSTSSST